MSVSELPFADGSAPGQDIVEKWLSLVHKEFQGNNGPIDGSITQHHKEFQSECKVDCFTCQKVTLIVNKEFQSKCKVDCFTCQEVTLIVKKEFQSNAK